MPSRDTSSCPSNSSLTQMGHEGESSDSSVKATSGSIDDDSEPAVTQSVINRDGEANLTSIQTAPFRA